MDLNSQSQKEMDIGKTYGEKTHIKQKDKSNIPSFISKTYEILEVSNFLFRKNNSQVSSCGDSLGIIFTSKALKSSNKRFYPFILDIKTLPHL